MWAAKNGADVINLSLNFDPAVNHCNQVPTVCAAIRKATHLGALVVGAAGNALSGNGKRRALFPGGAPHALAVGATTEHGCLAAYSDYGKHTDLLAPGGGQRARARRARSRAARATRDRSSSSPTACFPMDCAGGHSQFAIRPDVGTSMSAAHASGVAALVIASGVAGAEPDAGPARAAPRVHRAAALTPERFYGAGLLDAARAVDPSRECDHPGG